MMTQWVSGYQWCTSKNPFPHSSPLRIASIYHYDDSSGEDDDNNDCGIDNDNDDDNMHTIWSICQLWHGHIFM